MSNDSSAAPTAPIAFGGAITRDQFSLVQRMLLPWWGSMRMTAIWIVGCFLVFTVGLRRPTDTPLEAILASLIMSSVLILFVWRLGTFARNRQWRQLEAMQQTVTGKLGMDGLEWNTPMTSANFPWPKIIKIRRHPEMLLLFYSARCAFYLPRTFFATEAAWNEANALAIRQVPA